MKEILFPVLMSVGLSSGCSEQGFRKIEADTAAGVGEVTPLPDASASGEMFLEACGPVSSALAPLDKTNDSEPEANSLAAIDAYNVSFAEAVAAELEKVPLTEFVDLEVPITIGFDLYGEGYGRYNGDYIYVSMYVAIGDLSGAWQDWLNAGESSSVQSFFYDYDGIERFIGCRRWTDSTFDPTNYDWDTGRFGDKLINSDNFIRQRKLDSDPSVDIVADLSIRFTTRVIENNDSGSIGDVHNVTDFYKAGYSESIQGSIDVLLIDHGIEEYDLACGDGTTCSPLEDFVEAGDLVLATTYGDSAGTMATMLNLAEANVPEGESQALVVTQIGI